MIEPVSGLEVHKLILSSSDFKFPNAISMHP